MRHKDNGSTGTGGDDPQRDGVLEKSARAHGNGAQPPLEQQLRFSGNQDLTVLPLRARSTSGCLAGMLTHGKRTRARGGMVTYCGSTGEVLVPRHLAFFFTVFHLSQLYVLCIILLQCIDIV
jgi:hypothetical protein